MYLERPAFVLERRINQPLPRVNAVASCGLPLLAGTDVALGPEGRMHVDEPLRRPLGTFDLAWRSDALLLTARGHLVAVVEIDVDAWSADATRLQLRPAARHPERWSGRRLRRYFTLAHRAADHTARELHASAARPQLHPLPHLVGAVR